MNSIHEVIEYGYIVATNEDLDILITVNGAYYNIWCGNYSGKYQNTDCRATGFDNGLYGQDMVKVVERAEAILEELVSGGKKTKSNQ